MGTSVANLLPVVMCVGTGSGQLVGRADELSLLRGLVAGAASTCGPSAAVIIGEAGVGKTRLLAEATRQVDPSGVLRLIGFEPEQHVPLGAAAGLLHELEKSSAHGQALASLLSVRGPAQGDLESLRVFEAASRALSSLCPVLIVMDDLQWLDGLSQALAHYLIRAAHSDRLSVTLLCASRPSPKSAAFARSLHDVLGPSERFTEIALGPLDLADGARLAQVLDPELDDERATQICREGRGSPFWIGVATRSSTAAGDAALAITGLLRGLSSDAAACLAAVVVAARPIRAADLADVLGWAVGRTGSALTELVSRGVVSAAAGVFETGHDLVREATARQIPSRELTRLHGRFAEQLRRDAHGDLQLLVEALEHCCAAAHPAVGLALEIARSPQRRLLGPVGFARLCAVTDAPGGGDNERLELTAELAHMAEELGDHDAALARLTTLSEVLSSPAARAAAAVRAARHAFELSRGSEMTAMLNRARHLGGGDPWTEVAADALDFNRLAWLEHDAVAARACRDRAIRVARRLVSEAGSVDALTGPARLAYAEAIEAERVARLMDDDIDELLVVSEEMVEATRGLGERHLDAQLSTCMMLRFLNQWPEVATRIKTVLEEARRQIYPGVAAVAAYELALATYNLGRISEARELHAEARRVGERIDSARQDATDTSLCGLRQLIDASASDWRAAIESLQDEATRQDNPHPRLLLRQGAAMLAARFSAVDSAQLVTDLLEAADADAQTAECVRCTWELNIVSAELYARVGEVDRATRLLVAWDAAHPAPHARTGFFRERAAAVIAAATGRGDAVQLLRRVVESAEAAGTRLEQVWGLLDVGAAVVEHDREAAVEALTAACHLASELGAASERATAEHRLRDLGAPRVPAPRQLKDVDSPLAVLSRRELEVARLAARGARNTDIAASLFISARTVEQHLSRIFTKLGVRNRTELGVGYSAQLDAATTSNN
jgi:DNA-binding CsgD family transcriptional regulator